MIIVGSDNRYLFRKFGDRLFDLDPDAKVPTADAAGNLESWNDFSENNANLDSRPSALGADNSFEFEDTLTGDISLVDAIRTKFDWHTGITRSDTWLYMNADKVIEVPTFLFNTITDEITITFETYGGSKYSELDNWLFHGARKADGGVVVGAKVTDAAGNIEFVTGSQEGDINTTEDLSIAVPASDYNKLVTWTFVKNATTGYIRLYKNGIEVANSASNNLDVAGIERFVIGGTFNSQYWRGRISYFRINNSELSPEDIYHIAHPTVATQSWPQADFSTMTLTTLGGGAETGTSTVLGTSVGIKLEGEARRALDLNVSNKVGYNTYLEFDFYSENEGTEHAIAILDNDASTDWSKAFQLFGTGSTNGDQTYNDYQLSDGYKHYKIPIGRLIGELEDHDIIGFVNVGAGDSYFFNIRVVEDVSENPLNTYIDFTQVTDNYNPWTPIEILLSAWYDASDLDTIIAIEGLVSQWLDKSGNEKHATQSTSSLRPATGVDSLNGSNILSFSGETDDNELITPLIQLTTASIYYVFDATPNGVNSNNALLSATPSDGEWNDGGTFVNLEDFSTADATHGVRYGPQNPTKYINGALEETDHGFNPAIGSHQGTGLNTNNEPYVIGRTQRNHVNRWAYNGKLAEVIICPEDHDEATRQKIEGYLAWKWGLVDKLPYDHPYRWDGSLFGYGKLITPNEITTAGWFDAADVSTIIDTTTPGSAEQFNDKSGNTNHLEQTDDADKPDTGLDTINGLNVLTGNASQFMSKSGITNITPTSTLSIFAVAQMKTPYEGFSRIVESKFSDGDDHKLLSGNNDPNFVYTSSNRASFIGTSYVVGTDPFLLQTKVDANGWEQRLAGGTPTSQSYSESGQTIDIETIFLMSKDGLSNNWNGYVGEVIYVVDITDEDRQKLEGYLAHKWGLKSQLPSGHPYKDSAPAHPRNEAKSVNEMTLNYLTDIIIPVDHTVTVDTKLQFEVRGAIEDEQLIVAVQNDPDVYENNHAFKIWGSAATPANVNDTYDDYPGGDVHKFYNIPIGTLFTGHQSLVKLIMGEADIVADMSISDMKLVEPQVLPQDSDAILVYNMNETEGGKVTDESGNENHGTILKGISGNPYTGRLFNFNNLDHLTRPPVLWTPGYISTSGWFDGADLATIIDTIAPGRVDQWSDKSGNSQHLTQGTPAAKLETGTRTLNGLNVLDANFDRVQFLENSSFVTSNNGNFSVFIVARIDIANSPYSSMHSFGDGYQYERNYAPWNGKIRNFGAWGTNPNGAGVNPGPAIYCVETNKSANLGKVFIDGIPQIFVSISGGTGIVTPDHFRVFASKSEASEEWINGFVAEAICVADVTRKTRQKIEGYLAHKWGLTSKLPSVHPYKTSAPTVGTPLYSDYYNNLAVRVSFNETQSGDYIDLINDVPIYLLGDESLPPRVASPSGHAAQFIGTDYLAVDYTVPVTNASISFKFRTTNSGTMCMVATGNGQTISGADRYIELVNGEIQAVLNSETIVSSGLSLNDGNWHHVTYSYGTDIGGQVLIVDGVAVASGTQTTSTGTDHDFISVGARNTGINDYIGDIDDVRIYSEAISVANANTILDAYGYFAIDQRGRRITINESAYIIINLGTVITIGQDTFLEFDFESTEEVEWHGLGFTNDPYKEDFIESFKLFGTEDDASDIDTFDNYTLVDGIKHYKIPVGQHITHGDYDYIVFITNNDGVSASGDSAFSNVQVYDDATVFNTENNETAIVLSGNEILSIPGFPDIYNKDHCFIFTLKTKYVDQTLIRRGDVGGNGYEVKIDSNGELTVNYTSDGTTDEVTLIGALNNDIKHEVAIFTEYSTKTVHIYVDETSTSAILPNLPSAEPPGTLYLAGHDGSGTDEYVVPTMFEGEIEFFRAKSGNTNLMEALALRQGVKVDNPDLGIRFQNGQYPALFEKGIVPADSYGTIIMAVKMPSSLSAKITAVSGIDPGLSNINLRAAASNFISFERELDAEYVSSYSVAPDEVLVLAVTSISGENFIHITKNLNGRQSLATSGDYMLPTEVLGLNGPFELIRIVSYSTPLDETEERYLIRQVMKNPSVGLL